MLKMITHAQYAWVTYTGGRESCFYRVLKRWRLAYADPVKKRPKRINVPQKLRGRDRGLCSRPSRAGWLPWKVEILKVQRSGVPGALFQWSRVRAYTHVCRGAPSPCLESDPQFMSRWWQVEILACSYWDFINPPLTYKAEMPYSLLYEYPRL